MQIYSSDYGAIEKGLYDKRIYNCTLCKNKNKTKQIKTKQTNLIFRSISAYGAIEKICMLREYGLLKK
jgi:hypothetical protein